MRLAVRRIDIPLARPGRALAALLLLAACTSGDRLRPPKAETEAKVELTLVTRDALTGQPVPARLELLDKTGTAHVAGDALAVLCKAEPNLPIPPIERRFEVCRSFHNPQSGTEQFYSTGSSTLELAPGEYRLRAWKGLEYRRVDSWLRLDPGRERRIEVDLDRWIDMPKWEWFSADDHLHLPRPTPRSNAALLQWMAAEDIHVANLLQMGTRDRFDFAPQYAHGEEGRFGDGHHVLVSGQENPRIHFLGHMIVLGTETPIHYPDDYLNLRRFFQEGHRQGALNGVAHFGRHAGAQFALGLVLPHGLLDFMEVLQFEIGHYDLWYKILNTGFRLAPTAGTDYPWGDSYPGRERFYAKVRGGFTVDKWLEAVRAGHTFVTNGPMLSFRVDGKPMGSTLELAEPGPVDVVARALFEPRMDNVTDLEIIENGVMVRTFPVAGRSDSHIVARFRHEIAQSGWLAARAIGQKRDMDAVRQSLAHSAPIYVSVAGGPPLAATQEARRLARSWIVLLDDLEESLAEEHVEDLAKRPATAPVSAETIRQSRPRLLEEIREARRRFEAMAEGP